MKVKQANYLIASTLIITALLVAAGNAHAENPFPVPDHVWVFVVDSQHPVGVAWADPAWAGIHSSIQIYLCLGMEHPLELKLPVIPLGLLMVGVLAVLVLCLTSRHKQHNSIP